MVPIRRKRPDHNSITYRIGCPDRCGPSVGTKGKDRIKRWTCRCAAGSWEPSGEPALNTSLRDLLELELTRARPENADRDDDHGHGEGDETEDASRSGDLQEVGDDEARKHRADAAE